MIAENYYEKALANFKSAKILYLYAKNDEEQLNAVGYHLQQSLELAIKHILSINGVIIHKTHDIDQLISIAKKSNVDLYLPEYIEEHAEMFSNWESKTRYCLGYALEVNKIENAINSLDEYFNVLINELK